MEVDQDPLEIEGVERLLLNLEKQKHFHIIVGEDVTAQDCFAFVPKAALVDQLASFASYGGADESVRERIRNYAGDEMLLVYADADEADGYNFLICVTEEAKNAQLQRRANAAARGRTEGAQGAGTGHGSSAGGGLTAVEQGSLAGESKVRRTFVSVAPGAVDAEIAALSMAKSRPCIRLRISRQRKYFGAACRFGDREAHDGMEECRPYKDPNYALTRMEDDFAVQAVATSVSVAVQTARHMPVSAAVQVEPHLMTPERANALLTEPPLGAFIAAKAKFVLHALQQNAAVDVVTDALSAYDDDAGFGRESEPQLVELSQLSLAATGNSYCSSFSWQPGNRHVLATALADRAALDERLLASNANTLPSIVCIWNTASTVHSCPQVVLLAPADVLVVRFCPSQPNLIAGGLATGQVILWDLSYANAALAAQAAPRAAAPGTANATGADAKPPGGAAAGQSDGASATQAGLPGNRTGPGAPGMPASAPASANSQTLDSLQKSIALYLSAASTTHASPPIAAAIRAAEAAGGGSAAALQLVDYVLLSNIESSHRRPVTDVVWMPARYEVNSAGNVRTDAAVLSHQIVSSAFDGHAVVWDVNARKDVTRERVWRPLLRVPLARVSRPGEHAISRLALDPARAMLIGGTEDGEVVLVDWRAARTDQAQKRKSVVQSLAGHCSIVSAVARHPTSANILLSAGDWCFHVWHEELDVPLITSPPLAAEVTCAAWSPSRPAVLFIGRADGCLEIWDLLEKSHAPSRVESVTASSRITGLELVSVAETKRRKKQLLAVSDDSGCVRIFAVPRALTKPSPREQEFVDKYFAREVERIRYFESVIVPQRTAARQDRSETPGPSAAASTSTTPAPGAASTAETAAAAAAAAELAEEKAAEAHYHKFKAEFEKMLDMMTV